jgi:hypothetical protein
MRRKKLLAQGRKVGPPVKLLSPLETAIAQN